MVSIVKSKVCYFLSLLIQTRCSTGLCQAGTCYEQAVGASIRAYCQCMPGYAGVTCNQRIYSLMIIDFIFRSFSIGYFTCPSAGVFPDASQCAIGRFFYCQQALAGKCFTEQSDIWYYLFLAPFIGTCPVGQRFSRFTSRCDITYQCI